MKKLFSKIVDVKPNEVRALWLGFILFFVVLAGYYVIRPIRDNIGATQFENLWWMFTVVLVAMIVANALFSMIVARMSRRKFIPIAYRFFILNLVIFFVLMQFMPPGKQPWVDGCFFVWVSVFNLFATAVFWGFMTDIFTNEQGKRLFGFIAVGGSLGGMLGPLITASLVHRVSTGVLLLICAGMLEIAAQSIRFFPAEFRRSDSKSAEDAAAAEKPIGGKFWDGVTHICKSPYLFGLFLFILLYTLTSTWTYFQQSELTKVGFADRAARTAFFAKLDLSVNTLTLLLQIFLTGRLMKFLGVTVTLLFMPVLSLFGFAAMGLVPVLAVLAVFQVARRASTFAFMRPAREVLFTVLRREDKYKAKSFIDTFGYRCGDQFGAWSYGGMQALGLGLSTISYIAVPVVACWCALGVWLGRKQRALADAQAKRDQAAPLADIAAPEAA
ncbi:MAG: MFS transporter [Verrucomicrobia bacterium]|nr:MAG: MFS transporter [Verrucomicrobiota bacterium]